jgi:2'-hydroxyisoflavone reductase
MRILVLGGTFFLGRHLVEIAQVRGHELTLFNRGQRNPDLFPDVEKLWGNRKDNLEALRGKHWDAVIDTSGYFPQDVRASAEILAGNVGHYTFVSTMLVYQDLAKLGLTEKDEPTRLESETIETVTNDNIGQLKYSCEEVLNSYFAERLLVSRPGAIVGPPDPGRRFTYWAERIAKGGTVLAPGAPDWLIQVIDGRDLAEWIIKMVEAKQIGTYNTIGCTDKPSMQTFLDECQRVTNSTAEIIWLPPALIRELVPNYTLELPLWVDFEGAKRGMNYIDGSKAIANGLVCRPLSATIQDSLEWNATYPETGRRFGLTPEREQELLQKLKEVKS